MPFGGGLILLIVLLTSYCCLQLCFNRKCKTNRFLMYAFCSETKSWWSILSHLLFLKFLCNTGSRNRKIPVICFHTGKETLAHHTQAQVHAHINTASFLATPRELDETGLESYTRLHLHMPRRGRVGYVRGMYNKAMEAEGTQ